MDGYLIINHIPIGIKIKNISRKTEENLKETYGYRKHEMASVTKSRPE